MHAKIEAKGILRTMVKGLGSLFSRFSDHPGPSEAGNQRHTEGHPPGKRKALINCVIRLIVWWNTTPLAEGW